MSADAGDDDDEPLFGDRFDRQKWRLDPRCDGRLYAILNVDASASPEDIARAHRQLVGTLHPDKQAPEHREAATRLFDRVHQAYEILSDPARRASYDLFGESDTADKLAVARFDSPAQFRRDVEAWAREAQETELRELVQASGDTIVSFDARSLVLPLDMMVDQNGDPVEVMTLQERVDNISRKMIVLKHGFRAPFNEGTSVTFNSTATLRQRSAGVNVAALLRHRLSPRFDIEVGSSLLAPYVSNIKTKLNYQPSSKSFYILEANPKSLSGPPPLTFTFGRQLNARTTAFATAKTGIWSLGPWAAPSNLRAPPTMSIGITQRRGPTVRVDMVEGQPSLNLSRSLGSLSGLKLQGGATLSRGSLLSANLTASRAITSLTSAGVTLAFALDGSLTLRLRVSRLGQRFIVPIVLGEGGEPLDLNIVLGLIAVPGLTWTALHFGYLQPRKRRRIARKLEELRREHAELVAERKQDAEEAVELLREQVLRRLMHERTSPDGLVITTAIYGVFLPNGQPCPERSYEATLQVQALVSNSMLFIAPGRSKSNLLGFYDPAMGEPKKLLIRYTFRERRHEVIYDDLAAVSAPLASHIA